MTYAGKASEIIIHAFFKVKEMIKRGHSFTKRIIIKKKKNEHKRTNTTLENLIPQSVLTKTLEKF